jgi:anti-anti-sigma regulatory factor
MEVYETALSHSEGDRVIVDLGQARDASSAAFARLVLLRRALLESGRDLCVTNLRERAADIYHLHKLDCVLPEAQPFSN